MLGVNAGAALKITYVDFGTFFTTSKFASEFISFCKTRTDKSFGIGISDKSIVWFTPDTTTAEYIPSEPINATLMPLGSSTILSRSKFIF